MIRRKEFLNTNTLEIFIHGAGKLAAEHISGIVSTPDIETARALKT